MKKLMILMLVLGMVTAASASLTGMIAGANASSLGTFTLKASPGNMTGVGGYFAVMPTTAGSTVTGGSVADALAATGDASSVFGDSFGSGLLAAGGMWGFIGSFGTLDIPVGTDVLKSLGGTEAVAVDLYLIADDFSSANLIATYNVNVPEPMTLGLLALGGLFLRRKKNKM